MIALLLAIGIAAPPRFEPIRIEQAETSSGIAPDLYATIRSFLLETRADLEAIDAAMTPRDLRSRLLVEALQVINQASADDVHVAADRLLSLPETIKRDARRLVDEILGKTDTRSPESNDDDPTEIGPAPVRLRPYAEILERVVRQRRDEGVSSGVEASTGELEALAIDIAGQAIQTADLTEAERNYARAIGRRVASGRGPDVRDDPIQDDLDALPELLRREDAALRLEAGLDGILERADRLVAFGRAQLEASLQSRDPEGTLPPEVLDRLTMLAELTARGVPVSTSEVEDLAEPPEVGGGGGTEIAPMIDPKLWERAIALARSVDRGLMTAGLDAETRRATLRKFVAERLAKTAGVSLDRIDLAEVERIVGLILGASGPITNPTVVTQPLVITTPNVTTLPTVPVLIGPRNRPWWCLPGR